MSCGCSERYLVMVEFSVGVKFGNEFMSVRRRAAQCFIFIGGAT